MQDSIESSGGVSIWTQDSRIRGIVENVADAVIVIDTAGRIELFNPAAERLFGYSADQVMGRDVAQQGAEQRPGRGRYAVQHETQQARRCIRVGGCTRGWCTPPAAFPGRTINP